MLRFSIQEHLYNLIPSAERNQQTTALQDQSGPGVIDDDDDDAKEDRKRRARAAGEDKDDEDDLSIDGPRVIADVELGKMIGM